MDLAPVRVVLVDDDRLWRQVLQVRLQSEPGIDVVGEAGTAAEAVSLTARLQPDLVLLDLDLGGVDGSDCLAALLGAAPRARVLVVTGSVASEDFVRAFARGAHGVVLKSQDWPELLDAVRSVVDGRPSLPSVAASALMSAVRDRRAQPQPPTTAALSARERQVLDMMVESCSTRAMAESLAISPNTVQNYVQNIFAKLEVNSRGQAVLRALELQLISL